MGGRKCPPEESGHTCTAVPLGGAGVHAECEGSEAGLHIQRMGGGVALWAMGTSLKQAGRCGPATVFTAVGDTPTGHIWEPHQQQSAPCPSLDCSHLLPHILSSRRHVQPFQDPGYQSW